MGQLIVNIEDPSASAQPALAAAEALCGEEESLVLFHNLFHARFAEGDEGAEEGGMVAEARSLLQDKRQAQLEALAEGVGKPCAAITAWSRHGWQQLVRLVKQRNARMLIIQTRPQSRWKRLRLGNDDWELIRHCPAPLLLVRGQKFQGYRKILAAVDPLHEDDKPADLDRRILDLSAALSRQFQGEIEVLNLVPPDRAVPGGLADPVAFAGNDLQTAELEAHRLRVRELVAQSATGAGSHECVEFGEPVQQIVCHARRLQADLLVMGAVARSALKRLLVGSTAERVLDEVTCDVLIAKPSDFNPRLPPLASFAPIDF